MYGSDDVDFECVVFFLRRWTILASRSAMPKASFAPGPALAAEPSFTDFLEEHQHRGIRFQVMARAASWGQRFSQSKLKQNAKASALQQPTTTQKMSIIVDDEFAICSSCFCFARRPAPPRSTPHKSPMPARMPRALKRKLSRAVRRAQHEKAQDDLMRSGLPARQLTEAAISMEVTRVAGLSLDEQAKNGMQFTEPESIFAVLDEAAGEATVLIRASWLRTLTRATDRLPRRGDSSLPAEATIGCDELRAIYKEASGRASSTSGKQNLLPIIALSHFWREKSHPDPRGTTLALIVSALNARWDEFQTCGVTALGIFIE